MKVHQLVDWLEKNADPEGVVWLEVGGDGAIHRDTAAGVLERTKLRGYPEYVISSEPN